MKRKMKKILSVLLVVMMLCIPVAAVADAGGFSGSYDYDYSGSSWDSGSDWGSSDWDTDWDSSSGSNYVYIGDSDGGLGGFCFVVMVVVALIIIFSRRNKGGGKPGGTGSVKMTAKQSNKPTVDPTELKKKDPNFSDQEVLEKVSNQYVMMQNCWQDKDWEPMRAVMTDALWSQFDRQLDALKRSNRTNYVENIAVMGARIVGYANDKTNDILTIELRTRITDYTVDDNTGAVVSGSKTAEKFMTYEWTLIRSADKDTDDREDLHDPHCPNCGAPIAINHSTKCEYCGQVLTSDDYDWTVSVIRGITQITRGA